MGDRSTLRNSLALRGKFGLSVENLQGEKGLNIAFGEMAVESPSRPQWELILKRGDACPAGSCQAVSMSLCELCSGKGFPCFGIANCKLKDAQLHSWRKLLAKYRAGLCALRNWRSVGYYDVIRLFNWIQFRRCVNSHELCIFLRNWFPILPYRWEYRRS